MQKCNNRNTKLGGALRCSPHLSLDKITSANLDLCLPTLFSSPPMIKSTLFQGLTVRAA